MARPYKAQKREALARPEQGVEMRLRIPKDLHTALVQRAKRNNRILVGEVRHILQEVMEPKAVTP